MIAFPRTCCRPPRREFCRLVWLLSMASKYFLKLIRFLAPQSAIARIFALTQLTTPISSYRLCLRRVSGSLFAIVLVVVALAVPVVADRSVTTMTSTSKPFGTVHFPTSVLRKSRTFERGEWRCCISFAFETAEVTFRRCTG